MKNRLLRIIKLLCLLSTLFVCLAVHFRSAVWLSLSAAALAMVYHIAMRLGVGMYLQNEVDYRRAWFRQRSFEPGLYRALRIQRWNVKCFTFMTDTFDL